MISYLLVFLAAISDAIVDVCSFHYSNSIFTKLNKPMYWDSSISWKNKYINYDMGDRRMKKWIFGIFNYPVQLTDSFHAFKSLMIIFLIGAIVLYNPFIGSLITDSKIISIIIDFLLLGTIWNATFLLFYGKVLIKR